MKVNQVASNYYNQVNCIKPSFKKDNLQGSKNVNPKVSIILPIYNQEKYLAKALNSLQAQTLKDIEIICVNDGSKDKSLEILNEYAQKDERIRIIDQKNQGCGASRNNGLKIAKGDYIAFLDPDDWFEPEALEKLYDKAETQKCDMVVFNFNRVNEAGELLGKYNLKKRLQRFHDIKEDENFTWQDVKPRILGGLHPASWNKLYKSELIKKNNVHFAKSNIAEDNVFVFGASLNSKSIGYSDECLYNYLIRDNSAIRTKSDKNMNIIKSIDSVKKLITNLGLNEELKNEFDGYILRFVSYHEKQIKSLAKFREICQKRFSASQNRLLNERYAANAKLPQIILALLQKKG